jgi:hypothetical protein
VAGVSAVVAIYCDSMTHQTMLDPEDAIHVHQGETIGWAVVGDASTSSTGAVTWSLTFKNPMDDEDSLCGSTDPINQANPSCIVQSGIFEHTYRYQATVNACALSNDKPMARIKPSKKP